MVKLFFSPKIDNLRLHLYCDKHISLHISFYTRLGEKYSFIINKFINIVQNSKLFILKPFWDLSSFQTFFTSKLKENLKHLWRLNKLFIKLLFKQIYPKCYLFHFTNKRTVDCRIIHIYIIFAIRFRMSVSKY